MKKTLFLIIKIASLLLFCSLALLPLPTWFFLLIMTAVLLRLILFTSAGTFGPARSLKPAQTAASGGEHNRSALLVLDVQESMCGEGGTYPDGENLVQGINASIAKAREAGMDVV